MKGWSYAIFAAAVNAYFIVAFAVLATPFIVLIGLAKLIDTLDDLWSRLNAD